VLTIRLHGPVIEKTTISYLNIVHFSCIVSLSSEQKCVAGSIMKNSKVYCLRSVCSCFVIILKFGGFLLPLRIEGGGLVWLWYSGRMIS